MLPMTVTVKVLPAMMLDGECGLFADDVLDDGVGDCADADHDLFHRFLNLEPIFRFQQVRWTNVLPGLP